MEEPSVTPQLDGPMVTFVGPRPEARGWARLVSLKLEPGLDGGQL